MGRRLFLTRGVQNIQVGAYVERMQDNVRELSNANGTFMSGSLADLLTNRRQNFSGLRPLPVPTFGIRETRLCLTATTGVDRNLLGNTPTQRPNQVLPNIYAGGFINYLNPAAFQQLARLPLATWEPTNIRGRGSFRSASDYREYFRFASARSWRFAEKHSIFRTSSCAEIRA
jgi:hypothetical protein